MPLLLSLSPELLVLIAQHLRQDDSAYQDERRDLASLASVCKALHGPSKAELYRDVILTDGEVVTIVSSGEAQMDLFARMQVLRVRSTLNLPTDASEKTRAVIRLVERCRSSLQSLQLAGVG